MNLSRELIAKYVEGRCSGDEAAFVSAALATQPHLLEQYLGQEAWDAIPVEEATMPADAQERITTVVLSRTTRKRNNFFSVKRSLAAAAACAAIVAGVWWCIPDSQVIAPLNAGVREVSVTPQNIVSVADTLVTNNSERNIRLVLKDGSQILLANNSEVHYQPALEGQKREIFLTGEAYFKVAKNKVKPFVVYSHGISTTALGTSFTVQAFTKDKDVKVSLYSGKVVIKQVLMQANAGKEIYLLPGDNLTVNANTFQATIKSAMPLKPATGANDSTRIAMQTMPLVFNREPLAEVFKTLEKRYTTRIQFTKGSLTKLSFTGTIKATDSLNKVLQNIGFLNDLTITQTPKGYLISTSN